MRRASLDFPARHATFEALARLPAVPQNTFLRLLASGALLALGACARHAPPVVRPTVPVEVAGVADADMEYLRAEQLLLPVSGVSARAVADSYAAARGARQHLALDIMAPHGTPVLAAVDGRIWKLRSNNLGGTTIYAVDREERFVFYYAHLQGYRDGLAEGTTLAKGDVIGYVGSSGNASPAAPHLHFQLSRLGPDRKWWTGTPLNPWPLLQQGGEGGGRTLTRARE
jgi:murein DD-endopeptidase MepM/ murein hydrolase activator NlpD